LAFDLAFECKPPTSVHRLPCTFGVIDAHRYSLHAPTDIFSRLVLETLEPLSPDRKCFRMINGVLVERTVQDVVPALKTNSEGLKQVLDELVQQYKSKQDEMEKWKACDTHYSGSALTGLQKKHNITVVQQ
jgi:hypothetical protein